MTPLEIARSYAARGWAPVPIEHRAKGPKLPVWPDLRISAEDAPRYFNGRPQNIGVILGEASGGLVDIDLDSPEAVKLATAFLPPTPAVFGRTSNQRSHFIYKAPGLTTEQVKMPNTNEVLVELRSNTNGSPSQTVFPGSTHPSGEAIEWVDGAGEPAEVSASELTAAFHRLSAAVIAARAFPADGARHNATLSLIGVLVRSGWSDAESIAMVQAVRKAACTDPKKPVAKMVADARKRFDADSQLRGFPSFAEHFGESAADRFADLLGLDVKPFGKDVFDDLPDKPDVLADKPKCSLTFLTPADCASAPRRKYLWKGILALGDVGCIFGAPGAGKSLIAPHLGYMIAQGAAAFGHRTKPGKVFYVAAEDGSGMRGRIQALSLAHGDAPAFLLVDGVSDLGDDDFYTLMEAAEAQRPALIVIDTLAMAFPGLEENDAAVMGRVVRRARRLAETGAAVLLIHHDTKAEGAPRTPRGHSVLNGALDVAIHVRRDDDGIVRATPTKNRNGSCEQDIAFTIDTRALGVDEDGDPITAALVKELEPGTAPKREKPTAKGVALTILKRMADNGGLSPDMSGWVSEADWRAACLENRALCGANNPDSRERAVRRVIQGLAALGKIEFDGGRVREVALNRCDVFEDLLQ